jgi:uncharacterized protein YidB (DUF937 family)
MGLLDQVIGGLLGSSGASSQLQNVLVSMLSGGQQAGMGNQSNPQTAGFGGGSSGFGSGSGGGLANGLGGLISAFQQAGLGHIAESWVGNGANQQVSPQQLRNVFGGEKVQNMAEEAGMQPGDFLSQLSQHLPNAVNGLTPNGRLPDEGTVSV